MFWIVEAEQQIETSFVENYSTEDNYDKVWESYDEFCDTFYEEFQIS